MAIGDYNYGSPIFGGSTGTTKPTTSGTSSGTTYVTTLTYAPMTVQATPVTPAASQASTSAWYGAVADRVAAKMSETAAASATAAQTVRKETARAAAATTDYGAKAVAAGYAGTSNPYAAAASEAKQFAKEERVDTRAQEAGKKAGVPTRTVAQANPSDYVNTTSSPDTLTTAGAAARKMTEAEFKAEQEKARAEAAAIAQAYNERAQVAHDDQELGKLYAWLDDKIKTAENQIKDIAASVSQDLARNEATTSVSQIDPSVIIAAGQKKAQANVDQLTAIRREIKTFIENGPTPDSWQPSYTPNLAAANFTDQEDINVGIRQYFSDDYATRWWGPSYYRAAHARARGRWHDRFASLLPKAPAEPQTAGQGGWLTWLILASIFGVF